MLSDLLKDTSSVYPEETDIATFSEFVDQARKTNPRLLITTFDTCVRVPYGDRILKGDIEFFLNKNYEEDFGGEWSTLIDKIEGFKLSVKKLRPSDIDAVTKYMQGLVRLSEAYVTSKQ